TPDTYTVTYTTSGICANSSSVSVTIGDNTAPMADLATLPTITGECSATISSAPTATDNCAGTITGTTTDPTTYTTQGTHTVTWTYDDGNGNTSTQTVIIDDVTLPSLTCPSDIVVSNDAGTCSGDVTVPTIVFSDNCSGEILSWTITTP